jgi:hypothetical protein
MKSDVRKESSSPGIPRVSTQAGPSKPQASPRSSKRRPRRSAAAVTSYVIPDSDDEAIVEDDDDNAVVVLMTMQANKRKVESNLQRWIKHLSILLAEEQKKVMFFVWLCFIYQYRPYSSSVQGEAQAPGKVRTG